MTMLFRMYIVEDGQESASGDFFGTLSECHTQALNRVGQTTERPRVYDNALYYDYECCNSSICIRPASEADPIPFTDLTQRLDD